MNCHKFGQNVSQMQYVMEMVYMMNFMLTLQSIWMLKMYVVNAAGAECSILSTSLEFGFTDADDYSDLIAYMYVEQSLTKNRYGVQIGCGCSVGIKQNGICKKQNGIYSLIDSHQSTGNNIGAVITMSSSFRFLIVEYVKVLNTECKLFTAARNTYMDRVHVKT